MKLIVLSLILTLVFETVGAQTATFVRKANLWMQSTEAGKRKAAYLSWQQTGPEAMPEYRKALFGAQAFHRKALDELLTGSFGKTNPYAGHAELVQELAAERVRIIPLIRTDWEKEARKIAMLRKEIGALTTLHERVSKAAKVEVSEIDAVFTAHIDALVEIGREIERFEPEARSVDLDDEALRELVIASDAEASQHLKNREAFLRTRAELDQHEEATAHNASQGRWCSEGMKKFAATLNSERAALGLAPLRLEEKLSAASKGHSADMAGMGFFAHQSPLEGKRLPRDRAKLSGFSGAVRGENIFMGSTSPDEAYLAWFGSDGHRFIMMADGPNTLGVGIHGNHWTMMTGLFKFPKASN